MEDVKLKERLSANLRREMEARKLTTTTLAALCGWKRPRIYEILKADHSPTLDTVEALEQAMQVPSGSLLLPPPENMLTVS